MAITLRPGLAVDVDRVHALDFAEEELGVPRRQRVGQNDLLAEPDHGRRIGHAKFGESAGDRDLLPGGVVEAGSGPVGFLADVIFVVPMHHVGTVFGRAFGPVLVKQVERNIEVVECAQGGLAGPGFGGSAAGGVDDQTDGDVNLLLDLAREVVANGGDGARGLGRHHAPFARDDVDGVVGGLALDGEEANLGIVGGLDFVVGIFGELERQAHVGLPAAEPDVANENVVQFYGLMAGDLDDVGSAGRGRLDADLPAAVGAGRAGCGVFCDLNADLVTGIGPAPDGVGLAALENHVVAEDGTDEGQSLRGRGRRRRLAGSGLRECAGLRDKQKSGDCCGNTDKPADHECNPFVFT
jgi:hypothetical protein